MSNQKQKIKITIITVAPLAPVLEKVLDDLAQNFNLYLDLRFYHLSHGLEFTFNKELLAESLRKSNLVLLDLMGVGGEFIHFVCKTLLETDENSVIPAQLFPGELREITRMGSFRLSEIIGMSQEKMSEQMGKMPKAGEQPTEAMLNISNLLSKFARFLPADKQKDALNLSLAFKYWFIGGQENLKNLFLSFAREYAGFDHLPEPGPPQELPEAGIYHPETGQTFNSLKEYLNYYPLEKNKPCIGILFYLGKYGEASKKGAETLFEKLKPFCQVITVFFYSAIAQWKGTEALKKFFYLNGKPLVEAVVNLLAFRLNVGPLGGDPASTIEELQALNVPFFHPVAMFRREITDWEKSKEGLTPIDVITSIILPELDGCIEFVPISGLQKQGYSLILNQEIDGIAAVEERVEKITARILKWLNLRKKTNAEKKVALILYNYPPGEDNMGNTAYLDVFASLGKLLRALKYEGYNTGNLSEENLYEIFIKQGVVNSMRWTPKNSVRKCIEIRPEVYDKWFSNLPEKEKIIEVWGSPPGEIMTSGEKIILPGMESGNVFIGLQPSRGLHEKPEKVYHDRSLPPHYQYIAFYKWLEEIWGADVFVHVGTHGTLEFTMGKEVGMSGECFPDFLIGSVPHLYLYHVANPSEAVIAKRRSMATLVSYNSPSYTTSDLYEELAELEELIAEYNEAKTTEPLRSQKVKKLLLEKASRANLINDVHEIRDDTIDEIYHEILRIKKSMIPRGLHVLGEKYSFEETVDFVTFILRYDRGTVKSIYRLLCELNGIDYDYAIHHPADLIEGKSYSEILNEIEEQARELVKVTLSSGIEEALNKFAIKGKFGEEFRNTLALGQKVRANLQESKEVEALLQGLSGRYIRPNLGGDPIRTPEVLPTGCNIYQFDPQMIPTEAAYARGAEVAENTIRYYKNKYGRYPRCTAVILWGFETCKSQGETVGQILYYLGVRVSRKKGSWYPQLEIIPVSKLGRPRIDVVVNICGFFRDLFPNVMELLDEAFYMVASLEESPEENYLLDSARKVYREIQEKISDKERAWALSVARIFGPPAGEYGTTVRGLIETKNWSEESQLGLCYIDSMNYVYTKGMRAEKVDDLFRQRLCRVEFISQVRSSHDYEITDLDHYYEYFGGLAKSVEVASGKKPEMLFSDTTKEVIITEDVEAAIRRGVRTRLLNPKWINALLEHKYHGVQHVAERVENILGLAATTNRVDNWIWGKIAQRYIYDQDMRKKLIENNCWAALKIIEHLLEANKRGYWHATDEELIMLQEAYLEMEGAIEENIKE